jgi:hypothetical protein
MPMKVNIALITGALLFTPFVARADLDRSETRRAAMHRALEAQAVLPERAPSYPDAHVLEQKPSRPTWTPRKSLPRTQATPPKTPPGLDVAQQRLSVLAQQRAEDIVRQEVRAQERRREVAEQRGAAEGASMASERASFGQARAAVARMNGNKGGNGNGHGHGALTAAPGDAAATTSESH